MKIEYSSGAVVFQGDRVLIIRSGRGGHTAFSKGHIEPGETPEQAALREIREETGLRVALEPGFRRELAYSPAPDVMKTVYYFLAHPLGGQLTPQSGEVLEVRWAPVEEALREITYDNDRALLQAALAWRKEQ